VTLASSWDRSLARKVGAAIGQEALNKGIGAQILLGPDVDIHRSPLEGRNGESMSEDPFLTAQTALAYISGVQDDAKCSACIKHFAANNEEDDRMSVNAVISQRALHEIYLPAFETAVKQGKVRAVMAAYNKLNGTHCAENKQLLTDILRDEWGFNGAVMSDWWAVHSTAATVNSGDDLEMPSGNFLTKEKLADSLTKGEITQAQIDSNVKQLLRLIVQSGGLDSAPKTTPSIVGGEDHVKLAYQAACEGIVLLKNEDSLLPIDRKKINSIAIIGPCAADFQYGAVGSASVTPAHKVSPLDGIMNLIGNQDNLIVRYSTGIDYRIPVDPGSLLSGDSDRGLKGEYFDNPNLEGAPKVTRLDSQVQFTWRNPPADGIPAKDFSVRWTGKIIAPETGRTYLYVTATDGWRLWIDGKLLIDHWYPGDGDSMNAYADFEKGKKYDIKLEVSCRVERKGVAKLNWTLPQGNSLENAMGVATESDVAIVFVGTLGGESEGQDRDNTDLTGAQEALIQGVAAANRKTIVVVNRGGVVTMKHWAPEVNAIIDAGLPGEEAGTALASIIFGDVNPSGKLVDTIASQRSDYPDTANFHGGNGDVKYDEGVYVGYRGFDKNKIQPLFPFGHGLSYTSFEYSNMKLSQTSITGSDAISASIDITNTGRREGAEIVELYVRPIVPKIDRPIHELKGFSRVELKPGEKKTVSIPLDPRSFAYYDEASKSWKVDDGAYEIEIGASSQDIRQHAAVRASGVTPTDK
jgi:beta-glucosidase